MLAELYPGYHTRTRTHTPATITIYTSLILLSTLPKSTRPPKQSLNRPNPTLQHRFAHLRKRRPSNVQLHLPFNLRPNKDFFAIATCSFPRRSACPCWFELSVLFMREWARRWSHRRVLAQVLGLVLRFRLWGLRSWALWRPRRRCP
jgi:hypothetical protein